MITGNKINAVVNGKSLVEDSVKHYKGFND